MTGTRPTPEPARKEDLRRRTFLTGGLGAVGGALVALGARTATGPAPSDGAVPTDDALGLAAVPFHGPRQPGVGTPPQAHVALVAFDLAPGTDRERLRRLLRIWTDDAARLMAGRPALTDTEPELAARPARLTVTAGLGPGAFAAAGLDAIRPEWLAPLPAFGIDRLVDSWSGGDLVLQVGADDPVTVAHAVRVLTSQARTFAGVRWVQRGFRHAAGTYAQGTTMRNLMGQVDGTVNLEPGTDDDALIWAAPGAGPEWLVGGTSLVLRRIAMNLDTWDELDRPAREAVIGRRLDTGAPLTGIAEHDPPDFEATDTLGLPVIAPFAHIRRARPAVPEERFLRRVYSYDDAPAAGERSNSGLLFITFQADVTRQFVPVQRRLDEMDLLNRWTTPIGSAVFLVPPGCEPGEYLGQRLLDA